jgi:hypothetical protein
VVLVLVFSVAAVAAVVIHDFARYVNHFPYLAVDDGLANISYALASEGRYGFVASPTQGFTTITRHDGFFNYGPWYFYAGAVLTWLFGYSLALLRGLHLIGILAICVITMGWFGARGWLAAGALVALALLHSFATYQWPMVRPDIAVPVFAVLFIVSAGAGIRRRGWWWWLAAGVFAGAAAWSHLIAWSMVPAALVTLGLATVIRNDSVRQWAVNMAARAAGGVLASVMFYASFGFRIRDQLQAVSAYGAFLTDASTDQNGFLDILSRHVGALNLPPGTIWALSLIVLAAVVILTVVWRRVVAARVEAAALLIPALAVLIGYVLSLGTYANYHAGYGLLIHVASWWVAGAVLAVTLTLINSSFPRTATGLHVVAALTLVATTATLLAGRGDNPRLEFARSWVSIDEYTDQLFELVPRGASVWGTLPFGIESPARVQLVQAVEAVMLLERGRVPIPERQALAPSFLVWGYPESRDNTLQVLRGTGRQQVLFRRIEEAVGGVEYGVAGLIVAPPYGVTRVYRRVARASEVGLPTVAVFDPAADFWARTLDTPRAAACSQTAPGAMAVDYSDVHPVAARQTLRCDARAGQYLLRVHVTTSTDGARRLLAVTSSPTYVERISELGPATDFAPYFSRDRSVYLSFAHQGGTFYVHQFDDAEDAGLQGVDLIALRDDPTDAHDAGLPAAALSDWASLVSPGVRAATQPGGELVVLGDASASGYQVVSPAMAAPPGAVITLRSQAVITAGRVCLGALNRPQQLWLANGAPAGGTLVFTVDDSGGFVVVFYNCADPVGQSPTAFSVHSVRYWVDTGELYVDRLVAAARGEVSSAASAPETRVLSTADADIDLAALRVVRRMLPAMLEPQNPGVLFDGTQWVIRGAGEGRFSYLLRSAAVPARAGEFLVVRGRVESGGITVGLQQREQWVRYVNVTGAGDFVAVVEVLEPGSYAIVVANNLGEGMVDKAISIRSLEWGTPPPVR